MLIFMIENLLSLQYKVYTKIEKKKQNYQTTTKEQAIRLHECPFASSAVSSLLFKWTGLLNVLLLTTDSKFSPA